jgi:hypothetical protein
MRCPKLDYKDDYRPPLQICVYWGNPEPTLNYSEVMTPGLFAAFKSGVMVSIAKERELYNSDL